MDGETAAPTAVTKRGIHAATLAVMEEVGVIGKTRTNTGQNYKFRGVDDVVERIGPLLVKHGITVAPRVLSYTSAIVIDRGGKPMAHVHALVEHTYEAADGSTAVVTTLGEAMDTGDKASNKCMSAALKYSHCERFQIPTFGKDADTEAASPEVGATKTTATAKAPAKAAARAMPADDVEKEKGLLRALFETSVTVAELDAHWPRVKKLPNADIAELTPVFKARKNILTAQAAK